MDSLDDGEKGLHVTGSALTHLEASLSKGIYPADRLMTLDPEDERPLLALRSRAGDAHVVARDFVASANRRHVAVGRVASGKGTTPHRVFG